MTKISEIHPAPWSRLDWTGKLVPVDNCPGDDFTEEDVVEVIAYGTTAKRDWDGETAGIVRLKDGRFAAWEASWGPTGDGFCCDAYGGDADIILAFSAERARAYLSERAHELLDAK